MQQKLGNKSYGFMYHIFVHPPTYSLVSQKDSKKLNKYFIP